jgi:hypothetical protein
VSPNTDRTLSPTGRRLDVMDISYDIETIPDVWCRMWSGEVALAHDLMTPDCRQWSGQTPALDPLVGPGPAEAFMADYHQRTHNLYTARTLVVGDGLLAYSWDVRTADGLKTGIDVNVLRDGRIAENWTFVGPHDDRADLAPASASDLANVVARESYAVHREPVLDAGRGTAAYLHDGGVTLLVVRDGAVARRTTIGAARSFDY